MNCHILELLLLIRDIIRGMIWHNLKHNIWLFIDSNDFELFRKCHILILKSVCQLQVNKFIIYKVDCLFCIQGIGTCHICIIILPFQPQKLFCTKSYAFQEIHVQSHLANSKIIYSYYLLCLSLCVCVCACELTTSNLGVLVIQLYYFKL